jgi:hypothetical protein
MDSLLDSLMWIEELLPHDIQMIPKHGGHAYFLDGNWVLLLVERPGSHYEHKGVTYPFDLWKGCIFPIEQRKQNAFFLKYLFLENHPVHKNWLYIPADSENFEDEAKQLLREISRRNVLLGLPVKIAGSAKSKSTGPVLKKKKAKKKPDKAKENAFFVSMTNKQRN